MTLPSKVYIREVGPREGFQSLSKIVSTAEKIELIQALSLTGVREIETVSLVRPDRVPQMADADEVARALPEQSDVRYTALYLNPKGFVRGEAFPAIRNSGWLMIAVSDDFLRANNGISIDDMCAAMPEWFAAFRAAGKKLHGITVSTAFGDHHRSYSETDLCDVLAKVRRVVQQHGETLSEISLADTVGVAHPEQVRRAVQAVRALIPGAEVSLHLHDTRGRGLANAYAGLLEGVSTFDASVGGIGGCPFTKGGAGNICTEDFIALCHSLGITTGISLERYVSAAKRAAAIVGAPLPGKMYRIE